MTQPTTGTMAMPGAALASDAPTGSPSGTPHLADPKQGTLHMIGHAHIDPVWLWQWQEGFQEIKQTWRSALDRMREFPEFRFTASSAAFYEWVEQNEPRMFEEIRERVAEGRWEFVGWWVEPDPNIPGGESFVRQALYSQQYFVRAFGRTATVGFNPDGFGHAAGLPQILAKSGLPSYVFMRPQVHEKDLPRIFWWASADGSRVLTFRIIYEYGSWVPDLEKWVRKCMPELGELADELMVFYGVGNHGGGPTIANLESLRRLDELPDLPVLVRSTTEAYFDRLRAAGRELPVVEGELQQHAPGCYAAHSGVKRWNRAAESLLVVAERWATVAATVSGIAYPTEELGHAWKDVLFNQFHDTMAGTAIEPAYDDVRDLYGEASAIAGRALNHATQSIARRVAIEHDETTRPVVCFNPHAWPARLEYELEYGGLKPGDGLVDDEGTPVPYQLVRSHATVKGGRHRISFLADVPPLGYRVYRMVRGSPSAAAATADATDTTLDNGILRLEIDPETGSFRSLVDLRTGVALLGGDRRDSGAVPVVYYDGYDTWGHGLDRLDREAGRFSAVRIARVEHGPVKSVIRIESRFSDSRLLQDVTMFPGSGVIEVRCTVTWAEQWRTLKLRFPVAVGSPVATFEAAYAHIVREPSGREEPAQRWVDVSGTAAGPGGPVRAGLTLLNDGKYSYDVRGSDVGLTVLRSPVYAHHEPYLPMPETHYVWQDQGTQRFTYALLPHAGDWRGARVARAAAELNERPISLVETFHDGELPHRMGFAGVAPDSVVLAAMKRAEDDDDVILRLWETTGRPVEATVDLPVWGRSFTVALGAGELRTVRVPRDADRDVVTTDLLERPLDAP